MISVRTDTPLSPLGALLTPTGSRTGLFPSDLYNHPSGPSDAVQGQLDPFSAIEPNTACNRLTAVNSPLNLRTGPTMLATAGVSGKNTERKEDG